MGLLSYLYWCCFGGELGLVVGLGLNLKIIISLLFLEVDIYWYGESFFCFFSLDISLLILLNEFLENFKVVNIL